VVLVADHGESLGEHGEQTHGLLLSESVLRVPFLVRAPGVTPARTRDPVSLVDVAPTLLALAGVSPSAAVEGVDVTRARDAGRDLYAETLAPYYDHGWSGLRAIRRRGMKLVDGPKPELYDVPEDPTEARNLWPSPAGEALRAALHRLAERLDRRGTSSAVPRDFGLDRPDPRSRLVVIRELDEIACLPPESAAEAARRLEALARREPGSTLIRQRLAAARRAVREQAKPPASSVGRP
jgi:arylsulfatase A-like enzyme